MIAKVIKLAKFRGALSGGRDGQALPRRRPKKSGNRGDGWRLPSLETGTLTAPFVAEMMKSREIAPPMPEGRSAMMESGVLAFRREDNGEPSILLITKRRSKNWGIPKGKVVPHLNFAENAAKEAFEEAGVIGYVWPSSVGMFRSRKRGANPLFVQIIEVWVYICLRSPRRSQIGPKGRSGRSAGSLARPQLGSFESLY
jgi:ADP-ribose pyrophosphatase YjhB (NUDIX family)